MLIHYLGIALFCLGLMGIMYLLPLYRKVRIINRCIELLNEIFKNIQDETTARIKHALWVYNKANKALESSRFELKEYQAISILLASLLHTGSIKSSIPHELAKVVTSLLAEEGVIKDNRTLSLVPKLLDYIDKFNSEIQQLNMKKEQLWMLIPRYSVLLSKIGEYGIIKHWDYYIEHKIPLYNEHTTYVTTEEELWKVATRERYLDSKEISSNFIDLFYDRLLHLSRVKTGIEFFDLEIERCHRVMVNFVIDFGKKKCLSQGDYKRIKCKIR